MEMELRFNDANIEANDDGSLTVRGYVNETNKYSNMLGREQKFKEVIKPGVWTRALNKAKEVFFLAEHDKNKILASTRNGSLELREDSKGLYMEATISPTSWGKDYYQLIKDGILQNMSFGFRATKDSWRNMGDHFERTVNDLELFEVSVVRDPAYASSSISARGIDLVNDEVPASELNLRTIEIRSDEDIDAIAKRIFEMLKENAKVAEGHEVEVAIEEPKKEEEKVETVTEPNPESAQPVKEEGTEDKPEEKEEEVTKKDEESEKSEGENKTEESEKQVEQVETKVEPTDAEKLRGFINQYKGKETKEETK